MSQHPMTSQPPALWIQQIEASNARIAQQSYVSRRARIAGAVFSILRKVWL